MSTPSSSTSVLPPMSPRSVARLSRVNSTSGAFSNRSLQSFRTVPLPGLLPGTSLGILASGALDKRRDGAVRGGWAKRLFILSTRSLHYYRKTEEYELFGKERGQATLSEIGMARIVPAEDAPYGSVEPGMSTAFIAVISRKKSLLMLLRADSLESATSWVNTINRAIQVAQTIQFAPRWPVEVIQKFTSAASGNFEEGVMGDDVETEERTDAPIVPRVLVVSMTTPGAYPSQPARERLVKRQLELDAEVELGNFRPKDFCIIVLSDGEEIHIRHSQLGPNVQSLLKVEKELILSTPPRPRQLNPSVVTITKVHAFVRCTPAPPPVPLTPQNSGVIVAAQAPPSAFSVAFPGGLGGLFLLSCVVAFWFGYPFEGVMKITIVVGFVLAVSQVGQFVISAASGGKDKSSAHSSTAASMSPTAVRKPGEDLVYHIRVDTIEVLEQDHEVVPLSPLAEEEASESGASARGEADFASAISGGPMPFSQRFIAAEKGDEDKGRIRFENTLQWRHENDIDDILVRPHRTFETIKKYYPQYFHGRSKKGLPIYYEQPGKIDLNGLKRDGLSIDDLLKHYMYITEYLWRVIEPTDTGRSVTVLDVSGIGMSDLGGEVLDFIKRASAFTGAHYPERSSMIFIINIPGWFNMIWRMIKPLIDPVTREKIHMLKGSAILKELEMHIDPDQIPSDLGGRGVPLGQSQEEHDLREHVKKYLAA